MGRGNVQGRLGWGHADVVRALPVLWPEARDFLREVRSDDSEGFGLTFEQGHLLAHLCTRGLDAFMPQLTL